MFILIDKIIYENNKVNIFRNLKSDYLHKKIYDKHLTFLKEAIYDFAEIPELRINIFKILSQKAFKLKILKKYINIKNNTRIFFLRKYFKLFTKNTILNENDNFIIKNKMNKILKITTYRHRMILMKVKFFN